MGMMRDGVQRDGEGFLLVWVDVSCCGLLWVNKLDREVGR